MNSFAIDSASSCRAQLLQNNPAMKVMQKIISVEAELMSAEFEKGTHCQKDSDNEN